MLIKNEKVLLSCSVALTIFTYTVPLTVVCMHEQKAHGLQSVGVAIKNTVFVTLVDLAKLFKA